MDLAPQCFVEFWSSLSTEEKLDVLRACVLLYGLTSSTKLIVPRELQLRGTLATIHSRSSIVYSGCGTGKTLLMILPALLRPKSVSMIISPLKRLQSNQVSDIQALGIRAITVNEDTPNDKGLWKAIDAGTYKVIIVSPEQLGSHHGHLARFAGLMQKQRFVKKISHVYVDEAHHIYTAGMKKHGEPAFRPAWGALGKLTAILTKGTAIQMLSATLPKHILDACRRTFAMPPDMPLFRGPLLRPNLAFATMTLSGNLQNFHNLDFLIPATYDSQRTLDKTIIFIDDRLMTDALATYINNNLPGPSRNSGIAKHYHGGVSEPYLKQVYDDFASPNGTCRILGLDVCGIHVVIQYGLCDNLADKLQRGGRAGRDDDTEALFLTMTEPWALNVKLPQLAPGSLISDCGDNEDMDTPASPTAAGKEGRVGKAVIRYVQSKTCLRAFWAEYLGDTSPIALNYSKKYCCDRHDDNEFDLSRFVPGEVWAPSKVTKGNAKRKRSPKLRRKDERPLLEDDLRKWRRDIYKTMDFVFGPPSDILTDDGIKTLSKTLPQSLRYPADIVAILAEAADWAQTWSKLVFDVIIAFDSEQRRAKRITLQDKENEVSSDEEPLSKMIHRTGGGRVQQGTSETVLVDMNNSCT
ncbi:P-loop containing nucleoside triphosphate hydrolase protein [Gloeophyllum trabeum ATCC 11539]|uniref:DNA 3'-5' helicase n=1 Tax=Gloeophyllum trabeum (strain ATCC 11539 / FP-39264 / Madison 617) TaxID=670483 RepID=S7Q1M7_GLOTA|nr:P-loop containing nucleoside triphosphate hydrolase protein [Gloeophyllum trabeum ATCC 11539]EPQ53881.1 P-loop containing nucleoside triphosphate hydrolase protein [Gloeophyllum trabeum ATCC 11539]